MDLYSQTSVTPPFWVSNIVVRNKIHTTNLDTVGIELSSDPGSANTFPTSIENVKVPEVATGLAQKV